MSASPTFGQIKALVASIKQKNPQARMIGLRVEWTVVGRDRATRRSRYL